MVIDMPAQQDPNNPSLVAVMWSALDSTLPDGMHTLTAAESHVLPTVLSPVVRSGHISIYDRSNFNEN